MEASSLVLAMLVGVSFGSFLNVVVTRIPKGESLLAPASHCRSCRRPLAWWENVPLISYLLLAGRCRTCRAPIGFRYFLVELFTGMVAAAVAAYWLKPGGVTRG